MIAIIMMLLILKIDAAEILIIWLSANIHSKIAMDNVIVTFSGWVGKSWCQYL